MQDSNAAANITDQLLSMLSQYLVSNQSLEVNETFQVYLKILSTAHMKFNGLTTRWVIILDLTYSIEIHPHTFCQLLI